MRWLWRAALLALLAASFSIGHFAGFALGDPGVVDAVVIEWPALAGEFSRERGR